MSESQGEEYERQSGKRGMRGREAEEVEVQWVWSRDILTRIEKKQKCKSRTGHSAKQKATRVKCEPFSPAENYFALDPEEDAH